MLCRLWGEVLLPGLTTYACRHMLDEVEPAAMLQCVGLAGGTGGEGVQCVAIHGTRRTEAGSGRDVEGVRAKTGKKLPVVTSPNETLRFLAAGWA